MPDRGGKTTRSASAEMIARGNSRAARSATAVPQGSVRLGSFRSLQAERSTGGGGCSDRSREGISDRGKRAPFTGRAWETVLGQFDNSVREQRMGAKRRQGCQTQTREDDGLRRHRGIVSLAEQYATSGQLESRKRMERRETFYAPSAQWDLNRFLKQGKLWMHAVTARSVGASCLGVGGSRRSHASPVVLLQSRKALEAQAV